MPSPRNLFQGLRRRTLVAAPILALAAALAVIAVGPSPSASPARAASGAESAPRQTGSLRFTETRPGRPTEVILKTDYVNPDDLEAKPRPVRVTEVIFAAGTRVDTSVPGACTASDSELRALGEAACPPRSRVGGGEITVDTGFPGDARHLMTDVALLNNTDELIFLATERKSGSRVVARSPVRGRRVTNTVPMLPGTPPDGGALDTQRLVRDPVAVGRGKGRRGYVTTPPRCPKRGYWINRASFSYDDGVVQAGQTRSPCRKAGRRGRA